MTRLGNPRHTSRIVGLLAAACAAAGLSAASAAATPASEIVEGGPWTVSGRFDGADDLSGWACLDNRDCLAASDELRTVQRFRIEPAAPHGGRIVVGSSIEVLGGGDELDAEGVCAMDGSYYVVGSHGLSRKGKRQASRYHLLRLDGARDAERTTPVLTSLLPLIRSQVELAPFVDVRLQQGGVNIEAIACKEHTLFVGLRGPSFGNKAPVLVIDAQRAFSDSGAVAELRLVELGDGTGIRGMTETDDGFLILTGAGDVESDGTSTAADRHAPTLFWWDGRSVTPRRLGPLPDSPAKPEGLLLLEQTPTHYRVLVLSDSEHNGKPMEYDVGLPSRLPSDGAN